MLLAHPERLSMSRRTHLAMTWSARILSLAGGLALAGSPAAPAQEPTLAGMSFYPLPPCRILDTRPGSGVQGAGVGHLQPGVPFAFDVSEGDAACGVPADARAAVLDFVAVGPAGAGHLTVWPWDLPMPPAPNASVLNFTPGVTIANATAVRICHPEAANASCVNDLYAMTGVSAAFLVVDVLGYYAPPGLAVLWGEGRPGSARYGPETPRPDSMCANGDFEFGLSRALAEWNDAASACPAGTWVCTEEQRGTAPCDAQRGGADGFACHGGGFDFPADGQIGWLADLSSADEAKVMPERGWENPGPGEFNVVATCTRYPVWCCSSR